MISLLCKLFVKNGDQVQDPVVRRNYGTLVSVTGVIFNILLCLGKLIAGFLGGSVSITADALNNLSDAGSQLISLITFKIAAKPADRDHPFGHARIEYVASMAVSFLVLLIGVELVKSSIEKIFRPEPTEFRLLSVIVLGASILVKLWLFLFNTVVGKRIDSPVMRATAADSLSDCIATSAVLVSTLVLKFFGVDIDAYIGLAVAALILVGGFKILIETKNLIIGEAPSEEIIEDIRRVVNSYPEALGIHDLVVHNYGAGRIIASLHIEVDGSRDVFLSHDTIDNIERQLKVEHGIDCTIHMDPIVTDNQQITALRESTRSLIAEISPDWKIHDFRFVQGQTHTNLIFDVAVPFECTLADDEIRKTIEDKVATLGAYYAVVTIDKE